MPNLTYQQIVNIYKESRTLIVDGSIQKIHQPQKEFLLFQIRKPQVTHHLFFCLQQQNIAFFVTKNSWKNPSSPFSFCQLLRKHLLNGRIKEMSVPEKDRSLIIKIKTKREREETFFLRFELWGRNGNTYLLNHDKIIIGTLHPSTKPKDYFQIMEESSTIATTTPKKDFLEAYYNEKSETPWNEAADTFFYQHLEDTKEERKIQKLTSLINRENKKLTNKLKKLERSLEESKNNEDVRIFGELLKSNLHTIKRGVKEIEVINYFSEIPNTKIVIPLDPRKNAKENMQQFFKRYRKLEDSKPFVRKQIEKAKAEQKKWEKWLHKLEKNELLKEEDLPKKWRNLFNSHPKPVKKQEKIHRDCYRTFISQDDFTILVGRGSRDNDQLTFQVARGNDIWMHTEDYPGAHVIIPIRDKKTVPQRTLIDAAQLTTHYSKAKEHPKVSIAYTEKKHISKPKKAKPGLVYLANKKTFLIYPDKQRVAKLLDSSCE